MGFFILFCLIIIIFIVKDGLSGKNGGCGLIISIFIIFFVIMLFVKGCEQYKEDKAKEEAASEKLYDYIFSDNDSTTFADDSGDEYLIYYPTREMDGDPGVYDNELWEEGFRRGYKAGCIDCSNQTPYKSYEFMCSYKRGKASYKWGYWEGYKVAYKEIKKLSIEEVTQIIKERKKPKVSVSKTQTPSVRKSVRSHSDSYNEGYCRGYCDGEDDGAEGVGYGTSYDDSNKGYDDRDYKNGYASGYENGYDDYYNE